MANQSVRLTNASIVAALNNKADIELENSSKAAAIESLANSAATTANAASKVADAAVDLIEVQLPLKVNKSGDTFNGNVVIDGNLTVTGDVNIPADGISGSVEVATSATKDGLGNVISDTYLTKTDAANIYLDKTKSSEKINSNYFLTRNDLNRNYRFAIDSGGDLLIGEVDEDESWAYTLMRFFSFDDTNNPSGFQMRVGSSDAYKYFSLNPSNSEIKWNGNAVESCINCKKATSGYYTLSGGLQICWGSYITDGNDNGITITYPKSFSIRPAVVVSGNARNKKSVVELTTTSFKYVTDNSTSYPFHYIAIGIG